jgi:hypothetical protein
MQGIAGTGWPAPPSPYIEDYFSTYLYTGTGAAQTITNNIDLSANGGLVWFKARSLGQYSRLYDTARGVQNQLTTGTTGAQSTSSTGLTAFNSNGFTFGSDGNINSGGVTYVSWTFAKRSKFFDVVTYTGTGSATTIAHNLGSVPGCIIVKRLDLGGENWQVYHQSLGATQSIQLNLTDAAASASTVWNNTAPTASVFSVGTSFSTNRNGGTYVAYIFAHNAGGFGLTGSDNVISCGSYTGSSSPFPVITLGYEPQWVLIKRTDSGSANDWMLFDNMRGFGLDSVAGFNLKPNLSDAEQNLYTITPTATGFSPTTNGAQTNGAGATYIYIAIRRGPMKVPTDATKVFVPTAFTTNNSSSQVISVGFPSDMALGRERTTTANLASQWPIGSRLTGNGFLRTSQTGSEITYVDMVNGWDDQNSIDLAGIMVGNGSYTEILYNFQRAPGFFDEVCYTGNGGTQTLSHNLGVAPELLIVKRRSGAAIDWYVGAKFTSTNSLYLSLNSTAAGITYSYPAYMDSQPTATTISFESNNLVNTSAQTYVAYLFATCAGVSKVGSYTGTGTLTTINCGFSGGARFVLIKRTDSTSDWFVWDTSRGMTAGTDPSLSLNTTAAESNANSVYTITTGFQLLASPSADVNTNGGTYIYLAIA